MGLVLALCLSLPGCKYPTEIVYVDPPVEAPPIEAPEGGGDSGSIPGNTPEKSPEITGLAFIPITPLRAAYAVKGKTVGRIGSPVGGTAPFTYALASGDGKNDTDNRHFAVSGDLLQIQADGLAAGAYFVCLKVTDSKGIFYAKALTVTVAKDPAALDQETRIVGGIGFKMRFVPSGAFMIPDPMAHDSMGKRDMLVSVPTGFWMAETETTQELYQLIMKENPSLFKINPAPGEVQSRRPVDNLNWYETVLFCNRLSIATGREPVYCVWGVPDWEVYLKWAIETRSDSAESNIFIDETANGYRLPTANEWAWAAIGADMQDPGQINTLGVRKYYSGGPVGSNVGIEDFAWCYSNSSDTTHEVGKKLCNELGLFDMTGNVAEWVWKSTIAGTAWGEYGSYPISDYIRNYRYVPFERWRAGGVRIVSNQ